MGKEQDEATQAKQATCCGTDADTCADLNAYLQMDTQPSCCSSTSTDADHYARFADVLRKNDVNRYIASVNVFARKP